MIYKHGSYTHDVHVVEVSADPERNAAGQLLRTVWRFSIEGKVEGADQAAIKTAVAALETAYLSTTVTESGLKHSDGTTDSAHYLNITGLSTESGINARLRWVDGGAEYVYKRSFAILVECVLLGSAATEYFYTNTIERIGNGAPITVMRDTLSGPIQQVVYPSSARFGQETGEKSSRIGIVTVKPPTYPSLNIGSNQRTATGVRKTPDGITEYFAAWSYQYQSVGPF